MKFLRLALLLCYLSIAAQASPVPEATTWKSLSFLEGTWVAKTQGAGGVSTSGVYTFRRELGGHILARHSSSDPNCKGPANFDCEHGDLLYVFQDAPEQPLRAIYFDNEGHVIHYGVSTPTATTAVFLSEPGPGLRFRLVYELKGGIMSGKFQMQPPGSAEWRSYLEWSGEKK